jgi:hypothetical protein
MRTAIVILSAVILTSCSAGEWSDDPGNFKRAWGQNPPADVRVLHSWYWRSSHFTREEILFFQVAQNPHFRDAFIAANNMIPVDASALTSTCRTVPSWFAPGFRNEYSAWAVRTNRPEDPYGAFLLEHRATGAINIYACQL